MQKCVQTTQQNPVDALLSSVGCVVGAAEGCSEGDRLGLRDVVASEGGNQS